MSTYAYTRGTLVAAKVRVYNLNGWGAYSNANVAGASIKTTPTRMNTPVEVTASSSQMTVSWASLTATEDTGADSITYYSLEWN